MSFLRGCNRFYSSTASISEKKVMKFGISERYFLFCTSVCVCASPWECVFIQVVCMCVKVPVCVCLLFNLLHRSSQSVYAGEGSLYADFFGGHGILW